ncbi:MAG: hypothetical protein ACTHMZ_05940 [Actinomycetes bacterium]
MPLELAVRATPSRVLLPRIPLPLRHPLSSGPAPSTGVPLSPPADYLLEEPVVGAPLLVSFGGMPDPGTTARFEFRGLRRRLPGVTGLHLRDTHEAWYLRGLPGVDGGFAGMLDWLADQIASLRPCRTVMLGNSSGAYAALAAGAALAVDEVLAFVPRSGLNDAVTAQVGDARLASQRLAAVATVTGSATGTGSDTAAPLDLVPWVTEAFDRRVAAAGARPAYRTRLRVLHATDNREDTGHAERLRGLPETMVAAYPRGNHQLAKVLRDSGELTDLVRTALGVAHAG